MKRLLTLLFLSTLYVEVIEETPTAVTLRMYQDGVARYDLVVGKADLMAENIADHDLLVKALKKEVKVKKPTDLEDFKTKIEKKNINFDETEVLSINASR